MTKRRVLPASVVLLLALPVLVAREAGANGPIPDVDHRIVALVNAVSEERLATLLERLTGFGTRHTLSSDAPDRGIGAAAAWIRDELARSSPRLQASFDEHHVARQGERITRDVRLRNVVAVLPGRTPRRIYITAHYDTVARIPRPDGPATFDWARGDVDAPGANDDGSGTVLMMEAARALAASGLEFDATIVFAAFAGEEQGLVGSALHARNAASARIPIDAVLNNDLVGNTTDGRGIADGGSVRVFSEGPEDSPSRQLARFVRRHAARYLPEHRVRLIARADRFGRGGDHTPFNQHGFAAVRLCESNEHYGRQHTLDDTAAGVSIPYLARNVKVNLAAVAVLALAPPAPGVTDDRGRPLLDRGESGYDARLRWTPSPGAVAYRVFWREAWTPDWQHERVVSGATELVLPGFSIDDHVFGVAAIGPGGHESLVSAYVNPPRPPIEIRTLP